MKQYKTFRLSKKAATPISIGFFVFGVFALYTFTFYTLATKGTIEKAQIQTPQILEETYAKEALLNFYISELVKESAAETKAPDAQTFLDNFQNSLNARELDKIIPETKDIPLQLDTSIVEIENNQVSLKLKFKIDNYGYSQDREIIHVEYIYEKTFSGYLGINENEANQENL